MDSEEVRKRMDPTHLTTTEVKEGVEEAAKKKERGPDPEDEPRTKREYPFDFEWKDGRGKVWKGKFVNTVPDLHTRGLIGIMRSQLGSGIPFDSLDPATRELNLVLSHLSFSITKRPEWAEDLGALFDLQLLYAVYQEVAEHENMFLGYGSPDEVGGEKPGEQSDAT